MNDPQGYYAYLGVSPDASIDEIKAVYRALAKIYHPDVNRDKAAAEKFRRITEAYEFLTSPTQRRTRQGPNRPSSGHAQDPGRSRAQSEEPPAGPTPDPEPDHLDPVKCSICHRVSAQPRHLEFDRIVSFGVWTTSRPVSGIFCSDCARRTAIRASALTAALGWWGLPLGPFRTIGAILSNARGGERNLRLDEQLLWLNVRAFSRDKKMLSAALAMKLRTATNPDIARDAKALLARYEAQGVAPEPLKSPWGPKPYSGIFQIAVGSIVPVVATLFYMNAFPAQAKVSSFGDTADSGFQTAAPPPTQQTTKSRFGGVPVEPGAEVSSTSLPSGFNLVSNPPPQDLCRTNPTNGAVLRGRLPKVDHGHSIKVKNGSRGNAIVKMRNATSGHTFISFFIVKDQTALIDGIPDGSYRIQFAYGDKMTSSCDNFLDPQAAEFPGVEDLKTDFTETQVITQELSFTLYAVSGGNVQTQDLLSTSFTSD